MAPRLFAEAPGESLGRQHTRQAPRLKGLEGAVGGAPGLALLGKDKSSSSSHYDMRIALAPKIHRTPSFLADRTDAVTSSQTT